MKRRSRRNNEENALDLTPMMDIVFIMLILNEFKLYEAMIGLHYCILH